MKKKLGIAIGTLTGAAVLGLGIYQSDASQAEPKLSTDEIRQMVTDQYDGTITELELEKKLNKMVYEVEVEGNGKEYDLKLDGSTGEVLKVNEKEIANKVNVSQKDKKDDRDGDKKANNDVIDLKKAEEIALNEFDGTITDIELDEDDGRMKYEIEIRNGIKEAEIEFDAYTGEILELEIDTEEDDD